MSATALPLHCRDDGHGPAILLLHGLGGDHTLWNRVATDLATDHRVLAPDLRGHGRSAAPPDASFGFAEMEADLLRLLEEKGETAVDLGGRSAGALLALQYALDHPERVRSLVVVGAATHADQHTRSVLDRWAETLRTEGFDAYILRLAKDLFYPDWIEAHLDFLDRVREQQRQDGGRAVVGWGRAIRAFDLRGRLGRLRAPTLIIQAVDDQVVDAAHGRLLRQSIWGSELRLFAETGHLVPVERPTETGASIRQWVDAASHRPADPRAG